MDKIDLSPFKYEELHALFEQKFGKKAGYSRGQGETDGKDLPSSKSASDAEAKRKEIENVELQAKINRGIELDGEEPTSSWSIIYVIGFIAFIGMAVYILAFRPSLLKRFGFDSGVRSKSRL